MITSRSNARVKLARQLHQRKGRQRSGRWLVEGVRPLEEAVRHGAIPETVFVTSDSEQDPRVVTLLEVIQQRGGHVLHVAASLLPYICEAQTPQGIAAIVQAPKMAADVFGADERLLLIIDGVQDPGNMGTMCRTALAVNADGVIIVPGSVDPGNPKVVRASAGALFGLKLAVMQPQELLIALSQHRTRLVAAHVNAEASLFEIDWAGSIALLVGNEATGPSAALLAGADTRVRIPMPGPVESLNVSVAAALCLYEAMRGKRSE